jgi:hypothetical protein
MIITFLKYIQQYCHKPFNLIFFNEEAIKHYLQYRQKVSKCILHIDATGSVVKVNDGTEKKPFYYALTFKPSDLNKKTDENKKKELVTFSYANFLTTNNKTFNITNYLKTFFSSVQTISNKKSDDCSPHEVVCDFSWPLINSILATFNGERVKSNLLRVYRKFVMKTSNDHFTIIKLCINHMMKAVSTQLTKKGVKKEIKKVTLYLFGLLANTTTLESALEMYQQIYIFFNSEYKDELFKLSQSYLLNLIFNLEQG